jgi:hypothetical protein
MATTHAAFKMNIRFGDLNNRESDFLIGQGSQQDILRLMLAGYKVDSYGNNTRAIIARNDIPRTRGSHAYHADGYHALFTDYHLPTGEQITIGVVRIKRLCTTERINEIRDIANNIKSPCVTIVYGYPTSSMHKLGPADIFVGSAHIVSRTDTTFIVKIGRE